jgi:hypothetical protein
MTSKSSSIIETLFSASSQRSRHQEDFHEDRGKQEWKVFRHSLATKVVAMVLNSRKYRSKLIRFR